MQRDKLIALLDRAADAAFGLTPQGEVWSWNHAAEQLFGYPRAEVLRQSFAALLEPRGPLGKPVDEAYCQHAVREGRVPSFNMRVKVRSGHHLWANVSVLVFDALATAPPVIVHLAHDITPAKRREALARRLTQTARGLVALTDDPQQLVPVTPLSEQEQRLLRAFSEGKTPVEIISSLGISAPTLRNHLHHINQKLGTHNRLEAVIHAIRRGLI